VIRTRRGLLSLRDLVVVAAVGLIPAVAGCEAGTNAPTQQWHQPTPGASAIVNNTLRINNMFVLGPAPGLTLPRGASAGVFLALANDGAPDRLISITAPGAAATVLVPAGGISVGTNQSLLLSGPAPRVLLEHLTRTLHGGQYIRVNMEFRNAGHVSLLVPVMPRIASYGTFSPAPLLLRPRVTPSPLLPGVTAPTPTPTS
jgi:copper(I)-binding protein